MTEKETNRNYEEISRPYNSFLERSLLPEEKSLLDVGSTPQPDQGVQEDNQSTQINDVGNGSVETMPVKTDGAIGDVWIKNFIRSVNWKPKKVGFAIDGITGRAEFTDVYISGEIEALTGKIGGFTITSDSLYGTTTGTIKTAATVGVGSTGVIMDVDGLRGYDSVLGNTFDLPTDGSAPTFSSGIINETVYEISTNAILRTSSTVGDGSASSEGVLINNTGFYACEASQTLANANVKILTTGVATFSGSITSTSGAIGGFTLGATTISGGTNLELSSTGEGIITSGTLRTDSSGTRMQITAATQRLDGINANGDVNVSLNWSSTSNAVLKLSPIYDARRALEIVLPASFTTGSESDAKAITIANAADSISIDITDGGLTGLHISNCDTSAIHISAAPTNGPGIDMRYTGGSYPCLDLEQNGASANSYGIRIVQGTASLKEGIYIDDNANSNLSESIYIDRDSNSASDAAAMKIDSTNAGAGNSIGIDFSGVATQAVIKVATDNTDPTSGGGAATGRIPILVGSTLRYIAYY